MKVFHKDYIQQKTHQVMLAPEKNILVGDVLQQEWDYFICIPFQRHLHGKTKKEYEFLLRGFRHNLLTKLTTSGERKRGARLETFSALHRQDTNAHFHFAIKVPDTWKRVANAYDKNHFVRAMVEKVMVDQMRLVSRYIWTQKENEIFKLVTDTHGIFSYCVSDDEPLHQMIDTTNLYIDGKLPKISA